LSSRLCELFDDSAVIKRIKDRLPYLFQLAEVESFRGGKIAMEVGSARERIIVSLFMWKFGEENVDTKIAATETEVDDKVFGSPVSIKTITGASFRGVKLIWTVDAEKALQYCEHYRPRCDIVLAQISWNKVGGLYLFPVEAQQRAFNVLGREAYLVPPKPGTNPRGVEISSEALKMMARDERSRLIEILWSRSDIKHNPYLRWLDYWKRDEPI